MLGILSKCYLGTSPGTFAKASNNFVIIVTGRWPGPPAVSRVCALVAKFLDVLPARKEGQSTCDRANTVPVKSIRAFEPKVARDSDHTIDVLQRLMVLKHVGVFT